MCAVALRLFGARIIWLAAAASFGLSSAASAATINLSTVSSDSTPASQLDATLDFQVGDFDLGNAGNELKLTLGNPSVGSGGDGLFNINMVWWNAVANVTGLTLLSATHS